MGAVPENPYRVALRRFPARLAQAKKFYEFTNAADLDWNDVAEKVGMSTSVMSEVKLGKRDPRVVEGIDLATELGVRPEWLLLDSGPMVADHQHKAPTADQERRTTVVEGVRSKRPNRHGRSA
jgi:hypothetical protein